MPRVLVAEDSATVRRLIVSILTSDSSITVIGEASDGAQAVAMCAQLKPDVVTMDIQMPVMDGVEAARLISQQSGTPVLIVSSLDPADVSKAMAAFTAGALAVIAKPVGPAGPRFDRECRDLIGIVTDLARVKLEPASAPPLPKVVEVVASIAPQKIAIVGIVASTGGPIALRTLFKSLPSSFKLPILIVQHIAAGFTKGFADWLRQASQRPVTVATDGTPIAAGVVYIAPDDRHLAVADGHLVVSDAPELKGSRPSGTVLFAALAKHYPGRAAGVLLTGTGDDGVDGLRELRAAGGIVLVQDKQTCASFAAPRAGLLAGVAAATTPLAEIPLRLVTLATHERA